MLSVKLVMALTGLGAKELAAKLGIPWQRLNKRDSGLIDKAELIEKLSSEEWTEELSHYKNIESLFSEDARTEVTLEQSPVSAGSWMSQLSGNGSVVRYDRTNFEGEDAGVTHL